MKKDSKMKSKIVVTAVAIIFVMVTAAIVLAQNNHLFSAGENPNGDGDNATWKVEFTSIAEGEKTGKAVSREMPSYTSTYATFSVDFVAPGDSIVYDVQVSNLGTLDSVLNEVNFIMNEENEGIKCELEGLDIGTIIKQGESKNFKIKISYELTSTVAVEFDEPISISLNFRQAV